MMKARLTLAAAMLLVPCLAAAQSSSSKADPAEWVPADALAYVGITDVAEIVEQTKKTGFYRLTQDPASKDLSTELTVVLRMFESVKERLAKSMDMPAERLENPFAGPMAFYILTPPADDPERLPLALIASVGRRELMKDYYERAVKALREATDRYEAVSFASHEIAHFTRSADEEPAEVEFDPEELEGDQATAAVEQLVDAIFSTDSLPEELAMCLTDSRLVVATDVELVKNALRGERAERNLRETEDYRLFERKFDPVGPMRFVVNLPKLLEILEREGEGRQIVAALGLRGARSIVGHGVYGGEEYESKSEFLLLTSGERTGLLRILAQRNGEIAAPRFLGPDCPMVMSAALDVADVVDEIERITRQIDPTAADQMREFFERTPTPDGGTINLRQELIANLTPPLTVAFSFTKPYTPDSPRILLSSGHRDRSAIERVLSVMAEASGGGMTSRELGGTRVFDIQFLGVSIAITGDRIFAGTQAQVEALAQALPTEMLAEEASFRAAARLAPREGWGLVYVDMTKLWDAAIGLVEHREAMQFNFTNPSAMAGAGLLQSITGDFEPGRVEDARRVMRYYAPSIAVLSTTSDGILFTQYQLKPQGN